jgi:hypothetical protein
VKTVTVNRNSSFERKNYDTLWIICWTAHRAAPLAALLLFDLRDWHARCNFSICKEQPPMRMLSSLVVTLGLAGAMAALPAVAAAQQDDDQEGVQEAIRFEKDKQAAADRQARIEAARDRQANSADRMIEPQPKTAPAAKRKPAAKTAPSPSQTSSPDSQGPQI